VVVNAGASPSTLHSRCHACDAFDASQAVEGLFILPAAHPLNPSPGVDLAVGLPGACAALAGAAAAQGMPPAEVAAMLPCLARPTLLLIDGTNYTVLGPAAPLRLAALPDDCAAAGGGPSGGLGPGAPTSTPTPAQAGAPPSGFVSTTIAGSASVSASSSASITATPSPSSTASAKLSPSSSCSPSVSATVHLT
jgi:hypothetical protein